MAELDRVRADDGAGEDEDLKRKGFVVSTLFGCKSHQEDGFAKGNRRFKSNLMLITAEEEDR